MKFLYNLNEGFTEETNNVPLSSIIGMIILVGIIGVSIRYGFVKLPFQKILYPLFLYIVLVVFIIFILGIFLQTNYKIDNDSSDIADELEELLWTNLECIASFLMLFFYLFYHGYFNREVFINFELQALFTLRGMRKLLPVLAWGLNLFFYIVYFTISIYVQTFYNQNQVNFIIKQLKFTSFARRISSRLQLVVFILMGIFSFVTGSLSTMDKVGDAIFAKTGDRVSKKNFVARYDKVDKKLKFYKNIDWDANEFMQNGTINKNNLNKVLNEMNDVVTPEAKKYEPSFVLDELYMNLDNKMKAQVKEAINNTIPNDPVANNTTPNEPVAAPP